jgi:hypothetical protein
MALGGFEAFLVDRLYAYVDLWMYSFTMHICLHPMFAPYTSSLASLVSLSIVEVEVSNKPNNFEC